MWNQGMSWENSTFSHPTCISNKGWCTNCGPVKGRCSEVLEYLTTRCHIYGCVCHQRSHPAGCECWQQGKWGVLQELHDVSNRFHQHVNFPKRGTNTLDYDYIKCVSVCTLTSAENTASQVPSLLDTLNTHSPHYAWRKGTHESVCSSQTSPPSSTSSFHRRQ